MDLNAHIQRMKSDMAMIEMTANESAIRDLLQAMRLRLDKVKESASVPHAFEESEGGKGEDKGEDKEEGDNAADDQESQDQSEKKKGTMKTAFYNPKHGKLEDDDLDIDDDDLRGLKGDSQDEEDDKPASSLEQ